MISSGRIALLTLLVFLVAGCGGQVLNKGKMNANVDLALKHHEEVVSKGNMAVAEEIYANNMVRHSADIPDITGRDAYKQFILGFREAFPDWKETVENIIASGNFVATQVLITGTMTGPFRGPQGTVQPTGKSLNCPCAVFYRIADGRIAEAWSYYDTAPFLRSLGIIP